MLEEIHATVKNLTIAALRDTAEMPPPSRTITTASSIHPDFIGREAEEHTVIPDVTPALIRSHSAREKDFPPTTPALGRSRSME
jgi:hypothetical protein